MDGRLPVAAVFCFLLINVASLEIDPADGGYKDLLIAIHKDVAYNETIVDNIKALLQSSSEFLHRATNGRVFFKHVTIHFPNTWPKRSSARLVSGNSFEKSDVRFELPASAHEDRPFTKQTRPCGQPGDFIQIPPAFIAELKASTMAKYINPAYVFVHEWAHYRYGVFDEYGSHDDDTFPLTYCDDNRVRLNSCSQRIGFRATTKSGEKCMINKENCQLFKNCTVEILMPSKTLVESSIMFMPYQNNISQFCDSSTGIRRHNRFAPNKQNRLCQGKSTWEVISANEDFKKVPEPDMTKSMHVTFDETQQKEDRPQRVVLVLDVSGSMDDDNRMEFLQEAAARYIDDIPDGSLRLAIVTFETSAAVHHTLMPVNVNTRKGFLDAVERLNAGGSTCIGCGLERALEVLTTPDETPEGAIILLMSDGEENIAPNLADVTPKVVATKVEVSTMALGTTADNKLEKLAVATKGKAFFFEDLQGNTALKIETAFVQASTSQADEASGRYTMVMDTSSLFVGSLNDTFVLEDSLGSKTVVLIQRVQPESASIRAWLAHPNGKKCQDCRVEEKGFIMTILIPSHAEAGKWTLHVETSSRDEVEVNIQVKSQAKDPNDEPIRATCRMAIIEVGKANEAIILTDVRKGKKLVLNAYVTAEVTRPNQAPKVNVPLNDEGRDPDVQANDGTYSGYFAAFVGKGRYAVTAHVSSHKTTRLVDPKPGSGGTYAITPLLSHTSDPDLDVGHEYMMDDFIVVNTTAEENNGTSTDGQDIDPFQRVASGGSFQVTEEILEEQVPPGNIRDLTVVSVLPRDNDTLLVTLTWTWPGAHLTSGNASLIEIRASKDTGKLNSDFENQAEIKKRDIAQGNLDPLSSGAVHKVTLSLSRAFARTRPDGAIEWRAYLACRVANSGGLRSNTSNVVAVSYTSPSVTTSLATSTAATTTEEITEGTTTEVITTVASTAVSTTTESTTKTPSFTTVEASTSAHGAQDNQASGAFLPVRMWIVIGSITGVIVFAIVVGVLIKRNARNKRMGDLYVNRSLDVQRMTA